MQKDIKINEKEKDRVRESETSAEMKQQADKRTTD